MRHGSGVQALAPHGPSLAALRRSDALQVWPDGARYEGQWQHDMANGIGRFEHCDGDAARFYNNQLVISWCMDVNDKRDALLYLLKSLHSS